MKSKILIVVLLFVYLSSCQSEEEANHEKYKHVFEFLSSNDIHKKFVGINLRKLDSYDEYLIQSKFLRNYTDTLLYQNGSLTIKEENRINYTQYLQSRIQELLEIMAAHNILKVYTFYHDETTDKLSPSKQSEKYWLIFTFKEDFQLNYLNLKKERVTNGVLLYTWYNDRWILSPNIFN